MEHFAQAMGIDLYDERAVDYSDDEMYDTNKTFGSWGQVDEDIIKGGMKREWEDYLNISRVKDCKGLSVRRWWPVHRGKFPILSRTAMELLAVPAMSTEVECVFSG